MGDPNLLTASDGQVRGRSHGATETHRADGSGR